MSRCFSFPPPNYRKEEKILTESIKLQKEEASSKEKRKEKKRDKKEKRERSKDKKENSNDSERAHKKRKHNEANELHTSDLIKFSGPLKLQQEEEASKENRKEKKRDKKEKRERSKDKKEKSNDSERAHKKRKHNEANELHTNDLIKFSGALKLQKEEEASKESRKEKKRDKKEKRERSKDKKENSKDSERAHKKRKHDEANELHTKDAAAEPLERSGLTEEHGPSCLTTEPCRSSESTQTSSKGRKQGTIIRFKLPLRKHGDSKPAPVVGEEPCFSGRAASKHPEPAPAKVDEPCFSGRVAETPVGMELGESSKSHKRRRDKERKFRDLVIDWKPAPFNDGDEDLGWLLDESRRNRASPEAKSCNSCGDLSYGSSSSACSFQPRACYLPELDMYQLPYVVPF